MHFSITSSTRIHKGTGHAIWLKRKYMNINTGRYIRADQRQSPMATVQELVRLMNIHTRVGSQGSVQKTIKDILLSRIYMYTQI